MHVEKTIHFSQRVVHSGSPKKYAYGDINFTRQSNVRSIETFENSVENNVKNNYVFVQALMEGN